VAVPPHLPWHSTSAPLHHRLEQVRQPQEAHRRRFRRLRQGLRRERLSRDPPCYALRLLFLSCGGGAAAGAGGGLFAKRYRESIAEGGGGRGGVRGAERAV